MKKVSIIQKLSGFLLVSVILMSCSKNGNLNNDPVALKQALTQSTGNLNAAMQAIAATQAFQVFTLDANSGLKSTASVRSDSLFNTYILLDSIKGEYDYHPLPGHDRWGRPLIRFFNRTANNDQMIVRLPYEKIQHPRSLRDYRPGDSTLVNNFSIAVSDYHNNYNSYFDFDYNMVSSISLDNNALGDLSIKSIVNPQTGIHYGSQFAFGNGYTAKYKYESGDTTVSSFAILSTTQTLYEEKLLTVRNDTARFGHEFQYMLTIGNVQIVWKSGTHTAEVYLNGTLQPNAVVRIIDHGYDPEPSACGHREIQITFEDGTTTTVSTLLSGQISNISSLFTSLHYVYFAAYIVDWIAYDIYYKR